MKHLIAKFSITAALTLICLEPSGEVRAAEQGQTNVTVEVLIFSGRVNPTWTLQDRSKLELLAADLESLPRLAPSEVGRWPRLGFRGLRLHGGEPLGLPNEIRVFRRIIKIGQWETAFFLRDTIGLEENLINQSKTQELEPVVKEAIAAYEDEMKATQ